MNEMNWNSLGKLIVILLLVLCGTAHGNFSGSDDFDDNSPDPTKWGADFVDPATAHHGILIETNHRLEFLNAQGTDTFTFRPWIQNSGSYVEDWEVRTDVHLGDVDLPDESHLDVGIYVYKSGDICSSIQIPADLFAIV